MYNLDHNKSWSPDGGQLQKPNSEASGREKNTNVSYLFTKVYVINWL